MYEVSLSLGGTRIDAKAFLDAISAFIRLLGSVDQGLSRRPTVRWRLSRLQYSSPATIAFVGTPHHKAPPDQPERVGRATVSGIEMLERGERPTVFPDEALEAAKKLAELRGRRGVDRLSVAELNGTAPRTLAVSTRTAASVDDFIGPRFESYGAIEGQLEVISAHGGLSCNVYEPVFGKPVRCHVPEHLKAKVLAAFEKRVIASGTLRRDASGNPRTLALEDLEIAAPSPEPPQSLAGIAPDFTDGADTADWLKKRWQ